MINYRIYIYTYTHIYTYIQRQSDREIYREGERERESGRERNQRYKYGKLSQIYREVSPSTYSISRKMVSYFDFFVYRYLFTFTLSNLSLSMANILYQEPEPK